MRTADRHSSAVAAAAAAAGGMPIGPRDLPAPGTARADAQRAEASTALEAALDALRQQRSVASDSNDLVAQRRTELDLAQERLSAAQQSVDDAVHLHEEMPGRVDSLERRRLESEAALSEHREELDTRSSLCDGLDSLIDRATDPSATAERGDEVAGDLQQLALGASDLGLADLADAITSWATSLLDGNAPLDADAASLLAEQSEIDTRWALYGAGDPFSDPLVLSTREQVEELRRTLADLTSNGRSGNIGQQARAEIQQANTRRSELEEMGRRADPTELEAAVDAEQKALARVGFDSMLDFRIASAGRNVGVLAERRREVVAAELAESESNYEQALSEATRNHDQVRRDRAELAQRIIMLVGEDVDGGPPGEVDDQQAALLRRRRVPDAVVASHSELTEDIAMLRARVDDSVETLGRLTTERQELDEQTASSAAAMETSTDELETARSALELAGDACAAADADAAAELHEQERAEEIVRDAEAAAQAVELLRHTDEDLGELGDALVEVVTEHAASIDADADSPDAVVLDDPLADLDDDAAMELFQRLASQPWQVQVVYVTSRAALVKQARRNPGAVTCIDGRRRTSKKERRFGRAKVDAEASSAG